MGLATFFRGRISFYEVANSEMRYISTLRHIMYVQNLTEEGKNAKSAEVMEDEIIDH